DRPHNLHADDLGRAGALGLGLLWGLDGLGGWRLLFLLLFLGSLLLVLVAGLLLVGFSAFILLAFFFVFVLVLFFVLFFIGFFVVLAAPGGFELLAQLQVAAGGTSCHEGRLPSKVVGNVWSGSPLQ